MSAAVPPLLLRDPSISATQIAFAYAGDIWTVARDGGAARRVVTGYDTAQRPYFSPDGTRIAFTAVYNGTPHVYVVPASGGEPTRLTFHPSANIVVGWTPDGKDVIFRSPRASYADPNRLYTVPVTGGFPKEVPLPEAETGSFSPDGSHIAYVPNQRWEPFWQGYRGGQTTPIVIADLADSSVVRLPWTNSNDDVPMWVGQTVYFLSDRSGPTTLFAYDTAAKKVSRELPAECFDITSASAGAGAIVYAQFDTLHVYDLKTHAQHRVRVTIDAELAQVRPHWMHPAPAAPVPGAGGVQAAAISPTGARAVVEAHGAIVTVPADKGDVRTIADVPDAAQRDPAWSPDGKSIAYFSDAVGGEYDLYIRDQAALEPPRKLGLGELRTFFYAPVWSPDSKRIAFADKKLNLYYLDVAKPTPVKVATAPYESFDENRFEPAWSPDGRYLAYEKQLPSFLRAVFVYDTETRATHQLTDGMSDAHAPQFDASGKYLYFIASTNVGPSLFGLDMTSSQHPTSAFVYAIVLDAKTPSPFAPQSDEEPALGAAPADAPAMPAASAAGAMRSPRTTKTTIDLQGLGQRIVALPVPEANYAGLAAGRAGELYMAQRELASNTQGPQSANVLKFEMATRKVTPFLAGVRAFSVSANGAKALYARGPSWYITSTSAAPLAAPAPPPTPLRMAEIEVHVVPRAEWAQMYHEAWRIQRDFFYDPHFHGYDIAAAEKRFQPYLAGIASRDDLTFLFEEMLSYMSVGHMFIRGGTPPPTPRETVGLLGADYTIENGRYRFARIFDGENWNPQAQAPLTAPGIDVKRGEYLLAVNGHALAGSENVYEAFEETAGKVTAITVGPTADGAQSRTVSVVPIPSEARLRNLAWIEGNRRTVDRLSGGKLAYIYMPDTNYGGFTNFNRYFFAQVGRQGVILDERFNHGGQIADYVIDFLKRQPNGIIAFRDGQTMIDPPLAIFGPKVMIVNELAGSGGDALPWLFRKAKLGTIVGTRTWGGLVGIGGYPTLKDGGSVTAPRGAIGGLKGDWEVEGHGIAPDIEVRLDPKRVREGHDPQLEAAVAKAMEQLRAHPYPHFPTPPYPDHHPVLPAPASDP